jgi:rifampicin phosphotransferase
MPGAVVWLSEVTAADEARVGGKAYALARLRQAGLPVPDGFVAPPDATADAIRAAYERLQGPVAVRSSSGAEDTAEASFAGQYVTELDVQGTEDVLAAVERCRAAAAAGGAYARAVGTHGAGAMAVLVQRFVEPRAAGVAFTRHPADPGALLVESHRGRGEALVSGLVTPDRYVVDRATEAVREGPPAGGSLGEAALRAVTGLALEAEQRLGGPQDVEWAVDAAGAVVLQSRPITVEHEAGTHPGARRLTRANVGEVLPDAVTPLTASTVVAFLDHAMRACTDALGIGLRDGVPFMVLHQERLYMNLSLCLEVAERLPGVTHADAERLILGGGAAPPAAPRVPLRSWPGLLAVAVRAAALAARVPTAIAAAEARVAGLPRAAALAGLDDPALGRRLDDLVDVGRTVAFAHVAASGGSAVRLAVLGRIVGDDARVNRLVAGLDGVESVAPALAVERLAALDAEGWLLSEAPWDTAPRALREGLAQILRDYGHRALSEGELRASAWEDDPAPLVAALRVRARSGVPPGFAHAAKAEERRAEEEAVLARRALLGGAAARRAVRGAQDGVRRREHTKSLAVRMVAHARALAREAGTRLAARGRLGSVDDVYFLTLDEVRRALAGDGVNVPRLRRRRRRFDAAGPLPVPRLVDLDAPDGAGDGPGAPGDGIGVSAGVGAGPARVLQAGDPPHLEPGEVLVAAVLDAGLGPLLSSAAGAVAELGGMLSHGAVVARELGVPCVVDVRGATQWIRTGDRVVVDGGRGRVRVGDEPTPGDAPLPTALHAQAAPRDEAFHPLEDHPLARESVYINVQDPASGVALVASAGVRPGNRGEALLALALPDGRVLFTLELGRPRLDGSVAVGRLRVGFDPVTLHFEGRMAQHEGHDFPPAPVPLLLSPRTVAVSLELTFSPTTPAVDFCEGLPADALDALAPLGAHHVEQSGAWWGTAVVDGRRFPVAGTGSRDHSWGRRDWSAADWWRLFTLRFDADLAVHALTVCARGRVVEGGFVWRDGRAERITRVRYAGQREDGRLRSLLLEVATAGPGGPLQLQGTVARTVPIPVQLDGRPWRHLRGRPYALVLHENFTVYRAEGRTGYGMAEITERPL